MITALVSASSSQDSIPGGDTVLCYWARHLTLRAHILLVSFAAVIMVVTQRSSPLTAAHSSSAFLSLCYWELITCMYLLAARQSYFSSHLPPKTRFPEYGSLLLIGQFEERNAKLEGAAVSGEDRCVTTLITAAKETYILSPKCIYRYPWWTRVPAKSRHTITDFVIRKPGLARAWLATWYILWQVKSCPLQVPLCWHLLTSDPDPI